MKTFLTALAAAAVIPNCALARPSATGEPAAALPTKIACDLFVSNKITGAGAEERREASLVLTERGFFATVKLSAEGLLLQGGAHVSTSPSRSPSLTLSITNERTMKHLAFTLAEGLRSNLTAENENHKAHLSCALED